MLNRLIGKIFDTPEPIQRLLSNHPGMLRVLKTPKQHIATESVVRWESWASFFSNTGGQINGWCLKNEHYESFHLNPKDWLDIVDESKTENWECEIQDVVGLSASKSTLEDFESLDQMVQQNSKEMIENVSEEGLQRNLSWSEIRIINREKTSDHFKYHSWDGRLFLCNSGGSHHFAAARYIAKRIEQDVNLKGTYKNLSLNRDRVNKLCKTFDMYVIDYRAKSFMDLFNAMRSYKAAYLTTDLPRPYQDQKLVLLPKDDEKAMKVSALFRESIGFTLNDHFAFLLAKPQSFSDGSLSAVPPW